MQIVLCFSIKVDTTQAKISTTQQVQTVSMKKCEHEGQFYSEGESYQVGSCQICTCIDAKPQCVNVQDCQLSCSITHSYHHTFDQYYHKTDICANLVSKDCINSDFEIIVIADCPLNVKKSSDCIVWDGLN